MLLWAFILNTLVFMTELRRTIMTTRPICLQAYRHECCDVQCACAEAPAHRPSIKADVRAGMQASTL